MRLSFYLSLFETLSSLPISDSLFSFSFLPTFIPSFLPSLISSFPPSFLPSFLPSFFPSFPHFFLPSFLPSLLASFLPSLLASFHLIGLLASCSLLPVLLLSFFPSFFGSFVLCPFTHIFYHSNLFLFMTFLVLLKCVMLSEINWNKWVQNSLGTILQIK